MRRALELFGEKADAAHTCPGEIECLIYQSAGEPKDHACKGCPMLPTKPQRKLVNITPIYNQAEIEAVCTRVEELAAQQRAGFALTTEMVSPLEYQLLQIWHSALSVLEREQQRAIASGLMALFR